MRKIAAIALSVGFIAAESTALIAIARAETEQSRSAEVKYRGVVNLAPFKCDGIERSSFIREVCYDAKNTYLLINLNGTWYHYCEIDHGTLDALLSAESMGRFYNASIKGSFDCRTHRIPTY
jgi:hypothetical protein